MPLRIYNTLTREKEAFEPLIPGEVRMYVCGITSYAPTHIGHGRCYVAFDVIARWLATRYRVTYARNFTDIDDKIIRAANQTGEDPRAISERYIAQFTEDMAGLGCRRPEVEPKATEHVEAIIEHIRQLEAKGFAYAVDGDVFFEIQRFPAYGRLSGRSLAALEAGARVEVDPRKRTPHDFALWKSAKPGEPWWDSPWGKGRPGWHIECSAMSVRYLSEPFDIHGGGKDLMFPHHENEIAQSCAASGHTELARFWMHNGFVNLLPERCPKCGKNLVVSGADDGESGAAGEGGVTAARSAVTECASCGHVLTEDELKMSKSRGDFYPIREVVKQYEPEALRALLLMAHYRSPIQFAHSLIHDAEVRLDKNYETLRRIVAFVGNQTSTPGKNFAATFGFDPRARFAEAMDDDFNTARAIAELSELFHLANELIDGVEKKKPVGEVKTAQDASRILGEILEFLRETGGVLNLWQQDPEAYTGRRRKARVAKLGLTPAEIEAQIEARNQARRARDFKLADTIRDALKAKGIALKDSPKGTEWYVAEE